MKVTVFGTGYVGLVTGVCLAAIGNEVLCVDINREKIEILKKGKSPIYEKNLEELLEKNIAEGRISFSSDLIFGAKFGDYLFIAVGTPSLPDGSANLEQVLSVAETIGKHRDEYGVVINKSTVPVGTADQVMATIKNAQQERGVNLHCDVISNPEFLKQGDAIADFMKSDRIVIGAQNERAFEKMDLLYRPLGARVINMDIRSAELTKYAANTFLAARISFMNEIALLAEKLGADVESVRVGIGSDPRVGQYFLRAGCGYGGSCFPKDVKALIKSAESVGLQAELFNAIDSINERQKKFIVEKIDNYFAGNLRGKTLALWGLTFKPETDDMRDAPSRAILELLWQRGAFVRAYDPVGMDVAKKIFGERDDLIFCEKAYDALDEASALLIVTEWSEFQNPDFDLIKKKLKNKVIFDGRNIYEPKKMRSLGIEYHGIGRINFI